ncbi:dipeptide epimerase [Paracoccus suum]|uniref:Dipeptide epimerase n=1 Tax=Paracoccus suum TaxID=2259340 RepID=A0A344PGP8_9RHOB|nr:N-acetyl-D-Glu racemase DgcA [Paracoccus suum]AXC48553.1 dipeptide epimerase [Paracoccus suum]
MLNATPRDFPFDGVFAISRNARTHVTVVEVTVTAEGVTGHGECVPYGRYGETVGSVLAQIASLPEGITRDELQHRLPPGAARNGVDCALWDWEAKRAATPVWRLAGLAKPGPMPTAFTLSLANPEAMGASAAAHAHMPLLKIKLGGEAAVDLDRLRAVRAGAPDARLIVDANEGWDAATYAELGPQLAALGVALIEQPLPAGDDEALRHLPRPVPLCADESCHDRPSLPGLVGKYDAVNIKLDKTGGLTEALALRQAARDAGFGIMVGCMAASSLAMAPALLVAQGADFTDLDGPLLLAEDRAHPVRYDAQGAHPADPQLWG